MAKKPKKIEVRDDVYYVKYFKFKKAQSLFGKWLRVISTAGATVLFEIQNASTKYTNENEEYRLMEPGEKLKFILANVDTNELDIKNLVSGIMDCNDVDVPQLMLDMLSEVYDHEQNEIDWDEELAGQLDLAYDIILEVIIVNYGSFSSWVSHLIRNLSLEKAMEDLEPNA